MNHRKPRRLNPAQLRFLAAKRRWTKIRLNAWKTMPEKMEAIRVEATKQAAKVKDEKNDRIRQVVGFWPETLTTFQLRDFIAQDIDYTGKVTSLIYRMRRNGLLEFRVDGLWHNLCRLPYA
jgi:hypothetical protein